MPPPPARARLLLAGACLAAFTTTLDNTVVAVALRDVQRDLGGGIAGLQGTVTAYTVALAALLLTGGTLVDVLGRRRTLLAGLAVFTAASAGCALAGSVPVLIAMRAVQGVGAALVLPGSLAVLAGAYPEGRERARAVGAWAAAGALALVAGPLVGGLLVAASGWPAVFWVNLPLGLLVALAVLGAPEQPPAPGRRLDVPGQLLTALALGAAAYGVVLLGRDGLGAPALAALALAAGAAAVLVVVERRTADPVLPRGLLRDRRVTGAAVSAFAASLAVFVLLVFLSLHLQLVQAREALPTALRLLPLTVALVVAAPLAARWSAARGPRSPVVAGLLVAAAGALGLAAVLRVDTGAAPLGLLLAVSGAGLGLTLAPVVTSSLAALGDARSGLAGALVGVARELGGVVAVAGLGALVVSRLGADAVARLTEQGAPPAAAQEVVDVLLSGGAPRDVVAAAAGEIPLLLLVRLPALFSQSYVTSTRLALAVTAAVLAVAAALCARTLRGEARPQQP